MIYFLTHVAIKPVFFPTKEGNVILVWYKYNLNYFLYLLADIRDGIQRLEIIEC